MRRLEILVERGVRLVGGGMLMDMEEIYKMNSLLKLDQIYSYFCLIRMFKYFRLGLKEHFCISIFKLYCNP